MPPHRTTCTNDAKSKARPLYLSCDGSLPAGPLPLGALPEGPATSRSQTPYAWRNKPQLPNTGDYLRIDPKRLQKIRDTYQATGPLILMNDREIGGWSFSPIYRDIVTCMIFGKVGPNRLPNRDDGVLWIIEDDIDGRVYALMLRDDGAIDVFSPIVNWRRIDDNTIHLIEVKDISPQRIQTHPFTLSNLPGWKRSDWRQETAMPFVRAQFYSVINPQLLNEIVEGEEDATLRRPYLKAHMSFQFRHARLIRAETITSRGTPAEMMDVVRAAGILTGYTGIFDFNYATEETLRIADENGISALINPVPGLPMTLEYFTLGYVIPHFEPTGYKLYRMKRGSRRLRSSYATLPIYGSVSTGPATAHEKVTAIKRLMSFLQDCYDYPKEKAQTIIDNLILTGDRRAAA